jgi:2-desacetyl-2-hydroxyethyl bacteriochlorophyllide A dehydrogenase
MLSVVCDSPGVLRAQQSDMPVRKTGEVLLRVSRVGICGTDLHIFTGSQPYLEYPRVMGHELSAIVVEADGDSGLTVGDGVYVMPYLSCGQCVACRQGKTNCCVNIKVLGVHRDGAMTEYLSVPAQFVHKAEGVSLDQAAMLEFLAIGAHAVRRADVQAGQRVLVVGAGPIGMAAMIFAKLRGGHVVCLDTRADRLAFCSSHLDVDAVVPVGPDDTAQLSSLTNGEFFDVVFDASGSIAAMNQAIQYLGHGGKLVFVGVSPGEIRFDDPEFHKRETTLLASRNALPADFARVVAALKEKKISSEDLLTHRVVGEELPLRFPELIADADHVLKAVASF